MPLGHVGQVLPRASTAGPSTSGSARSVVAGRVHEAPDGGPRAAVSEDVPVLSGDLTRTLYERYQARDWSGAAELLHPQAQVRMPATEERLVGREQVLALQRAYPEPWGELRVLRVVCDVATAVAEVEITGVQGVFRCVAFWTIHEGLLHDGVEYWVTVGGDEPPADRAGIPA